MPEPPADGDRCMRNDGRRWRCPFPRFGGDRYCEKHYLYYRRKLSDAAASRARIFDASETENEKRKEKKMEEDQPIRVSDPSIEKKTEKSRKKLDGARKRCKVEEEEEEEGDGACKARVSDHSAERKNKHGRKPKMKKLDEIEEKKPVPSKRSDLDTPEDKRKKEKRGMKREGEEEEEEEEDCRVMELGQVWAFPEGSDGIPRSYARIDRIIPIPLPSSVRVTPLVHQPVCDEDRLFAMEGLSLACGLFNAADRTLVKKISAFTHKVRFETARNGGPFFKIFPKRGEIWAVYLWWVESTKRFEYKLVEVHSDFNKEDGVTVFALACVEGKEGVYRRQVHEGFYLVRNFSRGFLSMFSHRVPASRTVEGGETLWKVMLH